MRYPRRWDKALALSLCTVLILCFCLVENAQGASQRSYSTLRGLERNKFSEPSPLELQHQENSIFRFLRSKSSLQNTLAAELENEDVDEDQEPNLTGKATPEGKEPESDNKDNGEESKR